jgi:hypothetical protein
MAKNLDGYASSDVVMTGEQVVARAGRLERALRDTPPAAIKSERPG